METTTQEQTQPRAQMLEERANEQEMPEVENRTMLTDLYQLTMNAAYFDNKKNRTATFELFIRKLPEDWGFYLANGVEDAVDYATNLRFREEDIQYLKEQGIFKEDYLKFLKNFKFNGEIYAVREGTPVAPNTPLIRVTGKRAEAQLLETMLLNTVNFQTMIATKANRVVNAAGKAAVVEFGLRRAQEKDAAMKGTRAAYIGGAKATSNVLAGKEYGIPITGTHAHSFVMSFPSELEAFRAYVKTFPKNATLLIDTYDTIQGAKNAVVIAKEMETKGERLGAVRLDSGNLATLAKEVRGVLNRHNLGYVKILATNDLNEYKIAELAKQKAPIDGYGVGTELITAKPVAAIPGVYKLVEDNQGARIKLAEEKATYPGAKQVYRVADERGNYLQDFLARADETVDGKPLLVKFTEAGRRVRPRATLEETREYALGEVAKMPAETRQLRAQPYELKLTEGLKNLVQKLKTQYGGVR